MIKVNLLDSVTDRAKGVAAVEQKVANPRTQTIMLALVVFGLLTAGMLYDYYGTSSAHASLTEEKDKEQRIQLQMVAVNKERAELERKMSDVQARIDAIQRLRSSQQGPGAVLREIKMRFDSVPGLYLKGVEQKESELTIKGESPNEAAVTNFAKSLEFSSGIFKDLSIDIKREEKKPEKSETPAANAAAAEDKDAPKTEVITFTIKCIYSPPAPASPGADGQPAPSNQIAQK